MIQIILDPETDRLDGGTFRDDQVKEFIEEVMRLNSLNIPYAVEYLVDTGHLHL